MSGKGARNVVDAALHSDGRRSPVAHLADPFPAQYGIYHRFGFRDVGYFDTDLSDWTGNYRGYRVFRSYAKVGEVDGGGARNAEESSLATVCSCTNGLTFCDGFQFGDALHLRRHFAVQP
jgi:hypothetical protein